MARLSAAQLRARASRALGEPAGPDPALRRNVPAPFANGPVVEEYNPDAPVRTIGVRAPNHRIQMLLAWHDAHQQGENGLTDEQAAERAGLLGNCSWKRAGELRADGWIAWHPDGLKRKGHARVARKVSVITPEGIGKITRGELG